MESNTKILFGIFCMMLTLVFLYALTALGFDGSDSAFIVLILAGISLIVGLVSGISGFISSRKNNNALTYRGLAVEASSLVLLVKQLNGVKSLLIRAYKNNVARYNKKWSKTLCVNYMIGAMASFPQDVKCPFS